MIPNNSELTEDSRIILLLCSDLIECREAKKFTLQEWNMLAKKIEYSSIKTPRGLYEVSQDKWEKILGIDNITSERIRIRLGYTIQLGFELERLSNRGIWVITRAEKIYPKVIKVRLKAKAPIILYGSGNPSLLQDPKLAIVGSRDIDSDEISFTEKLAKTAVEQGFNIVSGGSRGTDIIAETAAIARGGKVISIISEEMEKYIQQKEVVNSILNGRRLVLCPFNPKARFQGYNALGRNKYIYALSDAAIIISAISNSGGTWKGAIENIDMKLCPMSVKSSMIKSGNKKLIDMGIPAITNSIIENNNIYNWIVESQNQTDINQGSQLNIEHILKQDVQKSIFEVVWPIVESYLDNPISCKVLSEKVSVRNVQMQDWLIMAIEKGYVKKLDKPVRYMKL